MKNKLTKIYNIFKQIENMNGSTGWDQIAVFYYFYENNQFINCSKLLYGLFCENRNLKPSIFGTSLMELRKFSNGYNTIYEFGNSEFPILIATFYRNGKHQISGNVKVEETLVSNEKEVMFVDGINVDSDKQIKNKTRLTLNPVYNTKMGRWQVSMMDERITDKNGYGIIKASENNETDFIPVSDVDALLLVINYVVICYHDSNDNLIEINNQEDLQEYQENYNDARLFVWNTELDKHNLTENFKSELEKLKMFRINGEIPESLESLEDCKLFLDYLYDDCKLIGVFHPDDNISNYTDEYGDDLFNEQQQEKYSKYLDDMFELDADGNSVFVEAGYEDVYDYCMNYRNDNHGINEVYPIKLNYNCTYVRRDGIISGILDPVDGESSTNKNDMIFHDTENDLSYNINGRLIGGEYNSKNAEDLISENFDYTSYLEDGKLSAGISFPVLPTKYPSSLNFVSDGLGGYVAYVTFQPGEETSEELSNFGLDVEWLYETNSWKITTKNGYENEVFFIDENNGSLSNKFRLQLNDVNHNCIISEDEDDENKFYLEFYDVNNQLIGDCEVYTDELKMVIELIEWTLPEYESEIDPDGDLFESEVLLEQINENF